MQAIEEKQNIQKVRMDVFEKSIIYDEVKTTFRDLVSLLNEDLRSQIVEVRSTPGFVGSRVIFEGHLSANILGTIFMFVHNVSWIEVEDNRLSLHLSGTTKKEGGQ